MMAEKDYESSDDDPDFEVPLENESSAASSESECENTASETDDICEKNNKRKRKGSTRKNKVAKKQSCVTSSSDNEDLKISPTEEKARADSLWQDFLSDTATSSKIRSDTSSTKKSANISEITSKTSTDKKENEVKGNSKEIIKTKKTSPILSNKNEDKLATSSQILTKENALKKPNNISNMLSNLKNKSKLTTLEKSKLDWNQFKQEHDLEEEISRFNRGKSGYLERQDFLQRTDLKQFEIEKELRNVGKRKFDFHT